MNNHRIEKQEEAQLAIALWKESGLSQGAFCKREGISRSTFQHWRKRHDSTYEYRAKHTTKTTKHSFIALEMQTTAEQTPDVLEVIYPTGVRIKCTSSVSDELLCKLISFRTA